MRDRQRRERPLSRGDGESTLRAWHILLSRYRFDPITLRPAGNGSTRLAASRLRHRRPQHLFDADSAGREHHQTIEAERYPAGLRHDRERRQEVLIDGIALAVDALLLHHLLF